MIWKFFIQFIFLFLYYTKHTNDILKSFISYIYTIPEFISFPPKSIHAYTNRSLSEKSMWLWGSEVYGLWVVTFFCQLLYIAFLSRWTLIVLIIVLISNCFRFFFILSHGFLTILSLRNESEQKKSGYSIFHPSVLIAKLAVHGICIV